MSLIIEAARAEYRTLRQSAERTADGIRGIVVDDRERVSCGGHE